MINLIPDLNMLNLVELNSYKLKVLESINILPKGKIFRNLLNLVEKEIKLSVIICNFSNL